MVHVWMQPPLVQLVGLHHLPGPLGKGHVLGRHHGKDTYVHTTVRIPLPEVLINALILSAEELKGEKNTNEKGGKHNHTRT